MFRPSEAERCIATQQALNETNFLTSKISLTVATQPLSNDEACFLRNRTLHSAEGSRFYARLNLANRIYNSSIFLNPVPFIESVG